MLEFYVLKQSLLNSSFFIIQLAHQYNFGGAGSEFKEGENMLEFRATTDDRYHDARFYITDEPIVRIWNNGLSYYQFERLKRIFAEFISVFTTSKDALVSYKESN